ncbi:hypothetical protein Pelo_18280 [Pelomyxa schiedti]|nr:hypothetical protein Pelo_18280 [Pelomyxa schiedti]
MQQQQQLLQLHKQLKQTEMQCEKHRLESETQRQQNQLLTQQLEAARKQADGFATKTRANEGVVKLLQQEVETLRITTAEVTSLRLQVQQQEEALKLKGEKGDANVKQLREEIQAQKQQQQQQQHQHQQEVLLLKQQHIHEVAVLKQQHDSTNVKHIQQQQQLHQQLHQQQLQHQQQQQHIDNLTAELTSARQSLTDMEHKYTTDTNSVKQQLLAVQQELQTSKQQLATLNAQLADARHAVATAHTEKLATTQTERMRMSASHKEELAELKTLADSATKEVNSLKQQLAARTAALATARDDVSAATRETADVKLQLGAATNELGIKTKKVAELEKLLSDKDTENKAMEEQLQAAQTEALEESRKCNEIRAQIEVYESRIRAHDNESRILTACVTTAQREVEVTRIALDKATAEVTDLRLRCAKLEAESEVQRQHITEAERQLMEMELLRKDLTETQQVLQDLEQEFDRTKRELEDSTTAKKTAESLCLECEEQLNILEQKFKEEEAHCTLEVSRLSQIVEKNNSECLQKLEAAEQDKKSALDRPTWILPHLSAQWWENNCEYKQMRLFY